MAAEYRTRVEAQQSDLPAPSERQSEVTGPSVQNTDDIHKITSRIKWFDARLEDENECLLTGIACVAGDVVVCDNENKTVKRFLLEGKFLEQLHLTDPCGICSLPNSNDAVITEPDIYRLTFCSLEGNIEISSTSSTKKKYECIAAFDAVMLVVGCCELGSSCVDVIDSGGNILRTIPNTLDGQKIFRNPAAVTCLRSGGILISDCGSSQLVCMSPDTGIQFKYDPKGRPSGVCEDSEGGIYMAQYDSNSVFKLSSKAIRESVVVDHRFNLAAPLAIALDEDGHLLLTEESPSTRVLVVILGPSPKEETRIRQGTNLSLTNVGLRL